MVNVNFLRRHLQPLLRSAPPEATEFGEITQNITPFKVIQVHRFWYRSTDRKLMYDFLLVIKLFPRPILHRFRDIASIGPRSLHLVTPLAFKFPDGGFPWDDLRKIFRGCQRMAKVPNGVETLPRIWTDWVGRTSVTDDRRTGDSIISERPSSSRWR